MRWSMASKIKRTDRVKNNSQPPANFDHICYNIHNKCLAINFVRPNNNVQKGLANWAYFFAP